MDLDAALGELSHFAMGIETVDLKVHAASLRLDEFRDGEPVTLVTLLVDDPAGETWNFDSTRALRRTIVRRAAQLGLPRPSVLMVPESEAELVEDFVR